MDELDKLLAEIQGEPENPNSEYATKEEWAKAVNEYKAKHGTTRGFQKGKLEYIDANGEKWSYAAGTRGGPGHPRRASSTAAYTERRGSMEVDQTLGAKDKSDADTVFKEAGEKAGVEKGKHQMHHMRTLNQYEPLLAGLSKTDQIEALKWFESEGFPLGNLEGNLKKMYMNAKAGGTTIADTHQGTGSIHEYMRKNRMEPNTRQAEYKQIAKLFEGKSLKERLPMYVDYLKYVQGDLQEKLEVPTDYTNLDARETSVGQIQSGPRAGERMPTNRSTLGLDPNELARTGEVNFEGEKLLAEMQGEPFMGQPSWRQRAAAAMGRVPLKGIGIGAITGAVGGAKPSLADPSTVSKLIKGDTQGLAADAVVGAGIGGGIQATIQGLSAMGRVGLANAAGFIAGKVAPPTFLGAGIADQTFAHPEVQRKYQEAEPGLPALGAAFSQFTPEMGKVGQTAPNRSQRNTLRRLQKDQEDR